MMHVVNCFWLLENTISLFNKEKYQWSAVEYQFRNNLQLVKLYLNKSESVHF